MLNKIFESKLLKDAFSNDIPKTKLKPAAEIYLKNDITIKETSSTSISCIINDKQIDIKSDVVNTYYLNNKKIKKDEYVLACLLEFKRNYLVNNKPKFDVKDFIVENNYYNNTYVTFFNIDEYNARIHFYLGVINRLFDLGMNDECLEYIVDFYYEIYNNFTFDNRYGDIKYYFKYQIIKNKHQMIVDNNELLIRLVSKKDNNLFMFADFMWVIGLNYSDILSNNNLKLIYDYILNNSTKIRKSSPVIKDIEMYRVILKWYNGEISDDFMKKNIHKQEVRYCYIKYLSENQRYEDIREIIKPTNFNITNSEINLLITEAFYKCADYEGAIDVFNRFNNISYERYLTYKEKFPILFAEPFLDMIITFIVDNYDDEVVQKIIIEEHLDKYQIYALAKDDFDELDKRFGDFVGKYDEFLIRIYQREIIKLIENLKWRYNSIPDDLIKKIEKIKKIKNGKYYAYEIVNYILHNHYISFSRELRKYMDLLEV